MRSALELGLLSVYYNINDEGHETVKEWYSSQDDAKTPRTEKIWKILLSHPAIFKFNDKFNLRQKYDDLSFLHNYVHTKGVKFSNDLGGLKGNFQVFEPSALITGCPVMKESSSDNNISFIKVSIGSNRI